MIATSLCTTIFISTLYFWYADCESMIPAIVNKQPFNADQDSYNIDYCVSDNDYKGVALLLAQRTDYQRLQIKQAYQRNYGQTLENVLKGKLKNSAFHKLMEGLLQPLPEFLARQIDWSLSQSHDWEYMSILCTGSGPLIKLIVEAYKNAFSRDLSEHIGSKLNDINGVHFLQSIISLSVGGAPHNSIRGSGIVYDNLISQQIDSLPTNGNCNEDNNQQLFGLMSAASFAQIKAVVEIYQAEHIDSATVGEIISNNCERDLKEAYSRIVRFSVDPISYWTSEIYEAGQKKDDYTMTMALIWRSEIDLATIRDRFQRTYHKDLTAYIDDRFKDSNYKEALNKLVSGN